MLREFSREWISSLVVRKAINVNVDESKKPEYVEVKHWDAQQVQRRLL